MKMKHIIRMTLLCMLLLLQQAFLCGSLSAQGFRPNPNALYKITNAHQGRALCTLHNSGDPANKGNQEPIIQYDYYGDATQKWKFKDNGDGTWAIVNAHSGKALCTLHNSGDPAYKGNQEPIIQYDNYGDVTQKWVLNDVGNGLVSISNKKDGRVMCTMHNSGDAANKGNQETIIIYDYYGDATQKWRIEEIGQTSVQPIEGAKYYLQARHSGKYLTTGDNASPVTQKSWKGDGWQQWIFEPDGNGWYAIKNANGPYVMSISECSTKEGAGLITWKNDGGDCQKFKLVSSGEGWYNIIGQKTNMAIDVAGANNVEGGIVCQWFANNGLHQQWKLIPADARLVQPVVGQSYYLQARHSGKYLTTGDNASPVTQKSWKGNGWQQWIFEPDGNGWYAIKNANGPYVMSISECSTKEGAGLIAWKNDGGDCQKFKLVANADGWCSLIGQRSKMAIDVAGANNDEGGTVCQWFANNGMHQQWRLVPVNGIWLQDAVRPVTPDELRADLRAQGLTLVQTKTLAENQCALINPTVDKQGNRAAAGFGAMTCAVKVGDNLEITTRAFYAGCDASLEKGAGAACEIAVASNDFNVTFPGGSSHLNVKGPSASACGSVSADRLCMNAGATVASASVSVQDDAGNGIGIGVEEGVGAGINGGYQDGVVSFGVNLKVLAGASITISVNPKDIGKKVMKGGEKAVVYVGNQMAAAGSAAKRAFSEIPAGLHDTNEGAIEAFGPEAAQVAPVLKGPGGALIDVLDQAGDFFKF